MREKHMRIPKLNLPIANLYDFIHDWEQEPFPRVLNACGKTDTEMQSIADTEWSSKSDRTLVMQTAIFDHSNESYSNSETMYLKEGQIQGSLARISVRISEDLMVSFAIIAPYRKRAWETKLRATYFP